MKSRVSRARLDLHYAMRGRININARVEQQRGVDAARRRAAKSGAG
jgi:hypothetical protein